MAANRRNNSLASLNVLVKAKQILRFSIVCMYWVLPDCLLFHTYAQLVMASWAGGIYPFPPKKHAPKSWVIKQSYSSLITRTAYRTYSSAEAANCEYARLALLGTGRHQ
jgi:hypothetical protein